MSQAPQQVVVVKSGCGRVALVFGIIIGLIVLTIGGCVLVGMAGCGAIVSEASKDFEKRQKERQALLANLEILDFNWETSTGGAVMVASFKIRNTGTVDAKDFVITCEGVAPSGTSIDRNTRTLYEIVKAGETRQFKNINMGFVASQVSRSRASITDAQIATGIVVPTTGKKP